MNAPPMFPQPPIAESPELGVRAWAFSAPTFFATQFVSPLKAGLEHAEFIVTAWELALGLEREQDSLFTAVHDWRKMLDYTSDFRRRLITWGRQESKKTESVVFVGPPDASPMIRMGASVSATALSLVGQHVEFRFEPDVTPILRSLGLAEPYLAPSEP